MNRKLQKATSRPQRVSRVSKKIRKGDQVMAISGNFRGQTGTVLSCRGEKVVVQGLNLQKKHIKKSQDNPQGGIIQIERPIHISNLRVCALDGRPVKLKVRVNPQGARELYYRDGDKEVLHRPLKTQTSKE